MKTGLLLFALSWDIVQRSHPFNCLSSVLVHPSVLSLSSPSSSNAEHSAVDKDTAPNKDRNTAPNNDKDNIAKKGKDGSIR